VKAHVEAMSIAHAVFLLPPFHGGGRREITQRPKCYSFDTGFVTFAKGWNSIREEDRGLLWEHLILDSLRTVFDDHDLFYWRDKSGREMDFIIKGGGEQSKGIECKLNPDRYDPTRLVLFRSLYPEGKNYVVSPNIKSPYERRYEKLKVEFISIKQIYDLKLK
jgi:predicted AAA+ superfamily ATPase